MRFTGMGRDRKYEIRDTYLRQAGEIRNCNQCRTLNAQCRMKKWEFADTFESPSMTHMSRFLVLASRF